MTQAQGAGARVPKRITGILFTDIEGSVAKWELFPEQMAVSFARHHEVIDAIVAGHDGRIHDRAGDGVFARFQSGNPLACALDLQTAFRQTDWSQVGGLSLRISVHAIEEDGPLQPAINRAARMVAAGWGGQIVVSAFAAAVYPAPVGARLNDLGSVHLRDIAAPVRLLSLAGRDWLDETFPPLRGVERQTPNLPLQSNAIYGRERDLNELTSSIRGGERVVSIVAAGGMGKTRLAIELARSISAEREVCFAALPTGRLTSDQLTMTLAAALRLPHTAAASPRDGLLAYLRRRDILIVLDNADGVCDDARLIDALCEMCPHLSLVTTSRAIMGWREEAVYKLSGLVASSESADFRVSPAALLFAQAARSYDPSFAFDATDGSTLTALCAAVRGAPLALQLMAQWLSIMPLREIAERLASGAAKLTDLDDGGQALREVFDGSWSLLDSDQRSALAALSIFPDDFDHLAAQHVTNVSQKSMLALERRSLLERRVNHRLALHPLTKEFALKKLAPPERREALLAQHARYFLQGSERIPSLILGPDLPKLSDRTRVEHQNMRLAWSWFALNGSGDEVGQAAEHTFYLCIISGLFAEALSMFEATPRDRGLRAAFSAYRGNCLVQLGRSEEAAVACREALAFADADEVLILAHAHQGLANVLHRRAKWDEALEHYHKALALRAKDPLGRAYTTMSLAWLELQRGNRMAAASWLEESETVCAALGFSFGVFAARTCRGDLEATGGHHARALDAYRAALLLEGAISHAGEIGVAYVKLGKSQSRLNDALGARASFDHALTLAHQSGDERLRVRAVTGMASLDDRAPDERRELFAQALRGSLDMHNALDASWALLEAARFEASEGNRSEAGEMFALARELEASPWDEYEAELAQMNVDVALRLRDVDVWRRIEIVAEAHNGRGAA